MEKITSLHWFKHKSKFNDNGSVMKIEVILTHIRVEIIELKVKLEIRRKIIWETPAKFQNKYVSNVTQIYA